MRIFQSPREAKQFFVAKIVEEARQENSLLSELEVNMLSFTEAAPDASPEMLEWAAQLDQQQDSADYEAKIVALLKNAYERELADAKRSGSEDPRPTWRSAYEVLSKEDHYILVMIDAALGSKLRKKIFGIF